MLSGSLILNAQNILSQLEIMPCLLWRGNYKKIPAATQHEPSKWEAYAE